MSLRMICMALAMWLYAHCAQCQFEMVLGQQPEAIKAQSTGSGLTCYDMRPNEVMCADRETSIRYLFNQHNRCWRYTVGFWGYSAQEVYKAMSVWATENGWTYKGTSPDGHLVYKRREAPGLRLTVLSSPSEADQGMYVGDYTVVDSQLADPE